MYLLPTTYFSKQASKHHQHVRCLISAGHISTYHIALQTSVEVCVKVYSRGLKRDDSLGNMCKATQELYSFESPKPLRPDTSIEG